MKKLENRGITLIALVVTIIVLLILAAVSINLILGENGIVTRAKTSATNYSVAAAKEKIELEIADLYAANLNSGEPVTFSMIANRLIEKGISAEGLTNEENSQIITLDGYIAELKNTGTNSWTVEMLDAQSSGGLIVANGLSPRQDIIVAIRTIKLTAAELQNGIKKITFPDGSEKTYNGLKVVNEEYEATDNGTYRFIIEDNKGETREYTVEVENILQGIITIVADEKTEGWQQKREVEVVWPDKTETMTKEISIDNGTTYTEYTGKVEITSNTIIKARLIKDGRVIREAEAVEIANVDSIKPETPTITNPSNGIETENDVTLTVGSSDSISGIAKYQVYYSGSWHDRNETSNTLTDVWNIDVNETVKYRVIDNAGNISEEATTQLHISKVNASITNMTSGDLEISATVALSGNIDYANTKYVFTTSNTALGTADASLYKDGTISSANSTITATKKAGTYYLHVLAASTSGAKKELISSATATSQGKKDFDYTGTIESITLAPGNYKFEVWGAEGGCSNAGKGGYSIGTLNLTSNISYYVIVGGKGIKPSGYDANSGGYNGGGCAGNDNRGGGRRRCNTYSNS